MIIVDTAIWVDHLHRGDLRMANLLSDTLVLMHPLVLGEIALGSLRDRRETLRTLGRIPMAPPARHADIMALIESAPMSASGLGYVDAHLIASTRLQPETTLWTRDRRLLSVARRLDLAHEPSEA